MQGNEVTLDGLTVTYPNGFTAVHPTDLTIRAGEFFSILGPSGCGKTTILRTVSGFVQPSAGKVLIGGQDMGSKAPNARPTALIFQNLALFPLMSVRENVAFGLEARGVGKRERLNRADELLDLVALGDQGSKKPGELSGGQRQRVAIARALAVEPAVLLLDEPLSALDLKLRQHMREELRSIQKKTGVTFLYITHDQSEALTMSDRVAVMNEGRIEQVGTGDEIYSNPKTAFAATFVGEVNAIPGTIRAVDGGLVQIETALGSFSAENPQAMGVGEACLLFIRPERLQITPDPHCVNRFPARLQRRDMEGAFVTYHLQAMANGQPLLAQRVNTGPQPIAGETTVGFEPSAASVLPVGKLAKTGREQAA
ncbi:ABC transporter ATP-binding protein [Pararhodobacter sp. CCB-MM2]|uniref:ABC transporter ATP-binding protein n=1 Tax=Pararhodobacter sp. CCB-MM2 TaxID=1786003 RepID=UPI00082CF11E|nr:ABC transporter ATP-binding protein [Pararhodobacter sp. CCB-MM2]